MALTASQLEQRILIDAAAAFFSAPGTGQHAEDCAAAGRRYWAEAAAWEVTIKTLRRVADPDFSITQQNASQEQE